MPTFSKSRLSRRVFLETAVAAGAMATLPFAPAKAAAKYTRYNATSPQGQKMLASYAKGVEKMLSLQATDPQNWFRNAFVHFLDCPHGNWWFYVWHRGYVGFFEETIRNLSGDQDFAMPYWDWTALPQIPDQMFDGPLTPTDHLFEPYTGNIEKFTDFIQAPIETFWNGLSPAQKAQQTARGYTSFDLVWGDVNGYSATAQAAIAGNAAYANTCGARYLSKDNPKLDKDTAYDCSKFVITSGLLAPDFYNANNYLSFNSSKTASHVIQPGGATKFSVLEGMPHNNVHNYIGGVGAIDSADVYFQNNGPYGNMTNFLSPVDPVFFLHHSNMDRLWDVWTRKQQAAGQPYGPDKADAKTYMDEPFLYFVNGKGQFVGPSKAEDYFSMSRFDYTYEPGSGEEVVTNAKVSHKTVPPTAAKVSGNGATVSVSADAVKAHLAEGSPHPLVASVTLPRPTGLSSVRTFDVLVNAPPGVTHVDADSPFYAGTIAFFGPIMPGMKMSTDATFAVPLPRTLHAFTALGATAKAAALTIRVVPAHGGGHPPMLKSVSVGTL
jgi:tyrosinase